MTDPTLAGRPCIGTRCKVHVSTPGRHAGDYSRPTGHRAP